MIKTADYYFDSTLYSLIPGEIVTNPGGMVKRAFGKGEIVGEILSYVDRPDGLYWQLKEGGFVKHAPGKFDMKKAESTGIGKQDEIKKGLSGEGDLIPDFNGFNLNIEKIAKYGLAFLAVILLIVIIRR